MDALLLEGKNAVVYGGGGAIGGAVARAFAREGARVHLAGRTSASLEVVAADIRAAGGVAETAVVDALDERAVDDHAQDVASRSGSLDISMNLIAHGDVQGTPMAEMAVADFLTPVVTAVRTTFLTARAAARHMIAQRSGVILLFGGDGAPLRGYFLGGLQVAFTAMETMRRQLSSELGSAGIRVVTLRTAGIAETLGDFAGSDEIYGDIESATMLGRAASLVDVGNAAVWAASDRARAMTAATINISAGALID
jgi:3-oxoacyl-[acyl-carrier protein] reductase